MQTPTSQSQQKQQLKRVPRSQVEKKPSFEGEMKRRSPAFSERVKADASKNRDGSGKLSRVKRATEMGKTHVSHGEMDPPVKGSNYKPRSSGSSRDKHVEGKYKLK